jgi:2-amino-4-hydroxy-6-hydroxymethyldihydropteridine diphosphokinase
MNQAYLSLGSNIQPEKNLPEAVARLAQFGMVRAVSVVWETAPYGFTDQPNFLNAALLLDTPLAAKALLTEAIATIEDALGRVRKKNKNAPRTIDLDLVLFNREVLQLGWRHIPAPEVETRPFVAIPLAEIAPDYVHPESGQTLRQIAGRMSQEGMQPRIDVILL